jgi:BirA family biotin operon repressor/biotin-[acetyl-CoA-carboxylase] ligase
MAQLDAALIRRTLADPAKSRLERFEVFEEIDSTSTFLKNQAAPSGGRIHVALADHQTDGRGRGERQWLSAPGESLCLSMSYAFERPPALLPAVTLALGVGIARLLRAIGVDAIGLKWPNDLLVGDGKLGGILTETQVRDRNAISVVAGVGINVGRPEAFAGEIDSTWAQAPAGLSSALREPPGREALAAMLIDAMLETFIHYDAQGFERFHADFESLDWLAGKRVIVDGANGNLSGVATGIDSTGALLVDSNGAQLKVISGSILLAEDLQATA